MKIYNNILRECRAVAKAALARARLSDVMRECRAVAKAALARALTLAILGCQGMWPETQLCCNCPVDRIKSDEVTIKINH